jgi:dUTPase
MTNSGGLIGQVLLRSVFALNSGYRIIQLVLQVDHDEQKQLLKKSANFSARETSS